MGHVCEVRDCLNCEERLASYCGKCVDAEREELNRLRRLVPTGTYTLNVAHEEEIQRLKDAGEVLIRSLERMTKERDEAREHVALLRKALKAYYHECLCQRPGMDEVNKLAYRALRETEPKE